MGAHDDTHASRAEDLVDPVFAGKNVPEADSKMALRVVSHSVGAFPIEAREDRQVCTGRQLASKERYMNRPAVRSVRNVLVTASE
jgi:hypothetical protein